MSKMKDPRTVAAANGVATDRAFKSVAPPLYLTSTFAFAGFERHACRVANGLLAAGVTTVACTPHSEPHIPKSSLAVAVARLQSALDAAGIALRLVGGEDGCEEESEK